jgi:ribose transport system permease protein
VLRALTSQRADSAGLFLALVVLVIIFSRESPYFFTRMNFSNIGVAISVLAVIASVQKNVLLSGGLDLSITATLALSGLVAQQVLEAHAPFALVLLAGLAVGVGAGLLNAIIIVGVGVNALVATIGTQFVIRGVAYIWTKGQYGNYFTNTTLNWVGSGVLLGVKVPIIIMVVTAIVVGLVMKFTRFGTRVYALGGSEYATRMSGISIWRLRTLIYVLSGLSAAGGGILLAGMDGTTFPNSGVGEELLIIGAVIIGGTGLGGGRGTPWGTFLGVILLGTLQNGMNLLGVQAFWQTFVEGVVVVAAVTIDEIRRKVQLR